jgi:hypothetical protein
MFYGVLGVGVGDFAVSNGPKLVVADGVRGRTRRHTFFI